MSKQAKVISMQKEELGLASWNDPGQKLALRFKTPGIRCQTRCLSKMMTVGFSDIAMPLEVINGMWTGGKFIGTNSRGW